MFDGSGRDAFPVVVAAQLADQLDVLEAYGQRAESSELARKARKERYRLLEHDRQVPQARYPWDEERPLSAGPIYSILVDPLIPHLDPSDHERRVQEILDATRGVSPLRILAPFLVMACGLAGARYLPIPPVWILAVAGIAFVASAAWSGIRWQAGTITVPLPHQQISAKDALEIAGSAAAIQEALNTTRNPAPQPSIGAPRTVIPTAAEMAPQPSRSPIEINDDDIARIWKRANAIRTEVLDAYAEFELDPAEVLFRRPLLADVHEPATATWLEALETMGQTFPDDAPTTLRAAQQCLSSAQAAQAAWKSADKRARDIGLGQLSDTDARRLDQARKLLTSAADRGTTDAERRGQIGKIIDILTAITGRPTAAVTADVQQAINARLLSLGAPPLRPAIEPVN